jgi:hypothetical protein
VPRTVYDTLVANYATVSRFNESLETHAKQLSSQVGLQLSQLADARSEMDRLRADFDDKVRQLNMAEDRLRDLQSTPSPQRDVSSTAPPYLQQAQALATMPMPSPYMSPWWFGLSLLPQYSNPWLTTPPHDVLPRAAAPVTLPSFFADKE